MANYNWPINPTTVNSGPLQFEINGVPTVVNTDTVTPPNSTPLPVTVTSITSPINTGAFARITNLAATAQTLTAPTGAIGFKIQAPSTNTENVSFSIGATATITAGILLEPGRSEDFDTGSNISVIATSATTQVVSILWKVRP